METAMEAKAPRPEKSGGNSTLMIVLGCLGIMFLLCVIGGIATYVAANKVINAAIGAVADGIKDEVRNSKLGDEQKSAIVQQIERLELAIKERRYSVEQVGKIVEKIGKGPLMPVIFTHSGFVANAAKLQPAPQEFDAQKLVLRRYLTALIAEKIDHDTRRAVLSHVMTNGADIDFAAGQDDSDSDSPDSPPSSSGTKKSRKTQLRDDLTAEQFAAFIAAMDAAANDAGISSDPGEPDFGKVIRDAVDSVVGKDQ